MGLGAQVSGLAPHSVAGKLHPHWQEREGSMAKGCLQRTSCHLCCESWLWMNSKEDSMGKAVIHGYTDDTPILVSGKVM